MRNTFIQLILTLALVATVACGGSKKALISQAEINQAQEAGQLAALFERVDQLIVASRGSEKEELMALQSSIAKLLVADKEASIQKALTENQTEFGLVDRVSLQRLVNEVEQVKKWDVSRYSSLAPSINGKLNQTEHEISEATTMSERTAKDVVLHMQWLRKASVLSGEGSDESKLYQTKLNNNIQSLTAQALEAYNKRMFNMSLATAQKGLAIDPGNLQFESMLSQSEAALFEQKFRNSLENGKPELAYQALQEVADKPLMQQVKKKMEKPILLLANYFANNAQVAYRKKDLLLAYSEFQRARSIQVKLSKNNLGFIQEKEYLDLIMNKVRNLSESSGAAYGLLKIVEEFDPAYPSLDKELSSYFQKLQNRATTKLSVTEFKEVLSANSVVASVGRRVGSKLEKILFDNLGNQIQIVGDLSALSTPNDYSGDLLSVEGEVLQAAIETSKNKGQRSVNVLTAIEKTETEEYADWKRRKRGEAPTQFNEQRIMEDVIIQVEHVKKLAVAEVAYRIIAPRSQKVLVTNNVVKEANYKGDAVNEFQKGLFHQKYVAADLPSDIKIMDNLATEMSETVGKSLITYLADPEKKYVERYQAALSAGETARAVELLANALVLSKDNNQQQLGWINQMKHLVLVL